MLSSFASILSLAFLVASISSTPINSADQIQCEKASGPGSTLVLSPTFGTTAQSDVIYVGLSDDTVTDSTGAQAKYLTTRKADGSSFADGDYKFDFTSCTSKYMGYSTVNEGKQKVYYGHIAPHVSSPPAKHCLTFSSTDVNSTSHTLMTDSYCSFNDDQSQILNFWSLSSYYGLYNFVGAPKRSQTDRYVSISDSGKIHFHAGRAPKGVTEYSFVYPH